MMGADNQRPDPDVLLAQVQSQEKQASKGKLRIYFGASAGVGKTYAMLVEARKLKEDGCDVIVGLVETHGRKETEALLSGLPLLPRKSILYRNKELYDFDIDAALEKHPQLILVDELAHSNIPGMRHPKRWQDVEELLEAGIDVFTTLNVQHLESLNDAIGGITNIHIAETVPDTIFDKADEVVMVDITADDLLLRLKAGKVYQGPQGELAAQNFFRKGNLIALRELALRRTAERLEDDVQAYRIEQSIDKIWKTDTALLACVGERPGAEYVIRNTARLACQLNAEWHVIYVETPALMRLPFSKKQYALNALKLAEELGATTSIVTGDDVALAIADYARNQNFSKIVLGRRRPSLRFWHSSILSRLAAYAPDFDLLVIGDLDKAGNSLDVQDISKPVKEKKEYAHYLVAVGAIFFTVLISKILEPYFSLINISLLLLLTSLLIAIRFGRGPALVASLIAAGSLDFFFIEPRYSFLIADWQQGIMMCLIVAIALITGHLTANLRYQVFIKGQRESRTHVLYKFAYELSSALLTEPILETTRTYIQHAFSARAWLLLPDDDGQLQLPTDEETFQASEMQNLDMGIAQWAFDHKESAGLGTDTLPGNSFFYLPLVAPMRTRGLLVIQPKISQWLQRPEERQQLDTFAALAAIALERVHFIQVAQEALVHMESERMRNKVLANLSYDLQTPLASLINLSESLVKSDSLLTPLQQELANSLKNEILHMDSLIKNLFEIARIKTGELKLNLQWHHFDTILINVSHAMNAKMTTHHIETLLEGNLPLVYLDNLLIERVLIALLDSTCKYTPKGTSIILSATSHDNNLKIAIYDKGSILSSGRAKALWKKLKRGFRIDLEIAICGAIIEAHGGNIQLGHSPEGGTSIICSLPIKPVPELIIEE
ncbi:DUF4118 domain-containing protein [Legionella hackeliae]|uniref:histidine kinase n=1 Tax=Legionella hackeliae TaxID=449 RepID=A0A0A8UWB8_LEGHA|nr:DUF4118 domain-containing protein [Legionella hackeliae]KTD15239.1 osmosensitive K+ channel His-kinase sensor [Legionella hackeliae]CEK11397.1 Sensor protein kdpD [Legionella hackeliae]STX48168.1 osmosensitive K+ channel His-kinase sensor [Legionella hackeliae]